MGIIANRDRIGEILKESLMLSAALTPHIGHDRAAAIANQAHKNGTTLKQEAMKAGISERDFDNWVRPEMMVGPIF